MFLKEELSRPWLVPVIQGYVQIEVCPVTFDDDELDPVSMTDMEMRPSNDIYKLTFKMCVISRRSRYRAGALLFSQFVKHIKFSL